MDTTAVHSVAITQTFLLQGVPATVIFEDTTRVDTRFVWDSAALEDVGRSRQLVRAGWLPADAVPSAPRGTVVECTEPHGGDVKCWRVDKTLAVEPGMIQVLVVDVTDS